MAVAHHDEEIARELTDLHLVDKPDGPGAAVMFAAAAGILVLGLLTTLNEMFEGVHTFLDAFDGEGGVGPLSGKTIVASFAFFATWAVLGLWWRRRDVDLKRSFFIALTLGVVGAILMFPPVFGALAG